MWSYVDERRYIVSLVLFVAIAFGLSYLIDFTMLIDAILRKDWSLALPLGVLRMYTVFMATVVALMYLGTGVRHGLAVYGALRVDGFRRMLKYVAITIAIIYAMFGLGLLYGYLAGYRIGLPWKIIEIYSKRIHGKLDPSTLMLLMVVSSIINGATINAAVALGEEIGWRGYALTVLTKLVGFYRASILIGVVWGLWHAPLIIFAGFNYPHHPDALGLAMFVAICTVWSVILSILRAASRSVVPPCVAHGCINAFASTVMLMFGENADELYTAPLGILGLLAALTIVVILVTVYRGRVSID